MGGLRRLFCRGRPASGQPLAIAADDDTLDRSRCCGQRESKPSYCLRPTRLRRFKHGILATTVNGDRLLQEGKDTAAPGETIRRPAQSEGNRASDGSKTGHALRIGSSSRSSRGCAPTTSKLDAPGLPKQLHVAFVLAALEQISQEIRRKSPDFPRYTRECYLLQRTEVPRLADSPGLCQVRRLAAQQSPPKWQGVRVSSTAGAGSGPGTGQPMMLLLLQFLAVPGGFWLDF